MMIKFNRITFALCALMVFASCSSEKKDTPVSKTVSLEGYLTDVRCGEGFENEETAKSHTRECALMPDCAETGFALYDGKKLVLFDSLSNEKAKDFLMKLSDEAGLKVSVKGEEKNGIMSVESISIL